MLFFCFEKKKKFNNDARNLFKNKLQQYVDETLTELLKKQQSLTVLKEPSKNDHHKKNNNTTTKYDWKQ